MKALQHDNLFKLVQDEDALESLYAHYSVLDVQKHILSEREAAEIIIPYSYHLQHEEKFIAFFKEMYNWMGCTVILRRNRSLNRRSDKRLGTVNQHIYKELRVLQEDYIMVETQDEIELLAKLSVLEVMFSDFIFGDGKIVIQGNYDLSFPAYWNSEESVLQDVTDHCGLFLRD
ncbi:hypothetical protein M3231_10635 [Neobacillus mesonae]|nr:hypothetical protein [Neobacillus mesonae]